MLAPVAGLWYKSRRPEKVSVRLLCTVTYFYIPAISIRNPQTSQNTRGPNETDRFQGECSLAKAINDVS